MKIPGVRNMVKDMCKVTRDRRDGITAWINLDPEPTGTDLKNCWDLVVRGKCDDVASLVHLPRFDESIEQGAETLVDDAKYQSDVRRVKLEVEIRSSLPENSTSTKAETPDSLPVEAKMQTLKRVQGIPTPSASPKIRTALPSKPVAKSKQAKLTFSSHTSKATSTSAAKISRKATQRKTKQAKKPEPKSKATINAAFKATKSNVAAPAKVPAKRALETEPTILDDKARSVYSSDFSLRPRGPKHIPETYVTLKNARPLTQQPNISSLRPSTPEQKAQFPPSQDTVSPPSKPRGMGILID
jgi:NAD-dependent histone deacetylase SIR2